VEVKDFRYYGNRGISLQFTGRYAMKPRSAADLHVIDSASRAVSPRLGKPGFDATSNFIRPNQ
jgi:hypothetical protein